MTSKPAPGAPQQNPKIVHPGMMGDGTEEQNLNETGDPSLRIKKGEVAEAFNNEKPKKA